MAKLIFDLLIIGVVAFVGYGICISVENKRIANMIAGIALVIMLVTFMQDMKPIIQWWSVKIESWQNTADKIGNIGQGSWQMQMKGEISQPYKGNAHHGIDIAAPLGTPVEATRKGLVKSVGWSDIYGNVVIVDHGDGLESLYGHLQGISVKVGYPTIAGTGIGTCGSTGHSTGPHLHFEIRKNGVASDPMSYLK